jgi:hypothetical protein
MLVLRVFPRPRDGYCGRLDFAGGAGRPRPAFDRMTDNAVEYRPDRIRIVVYRPGRIRIRVCLQAYRNLPKTTRF